MVAEIEAYTAQLATGYPHMSDQFVALHVADHVQPLVWEIYEPRSEPRGYREFVTPVLERLRAA